MQGMNACNGACNFYLLIQEGFRVDEYIETKVAFVGGRHSTSGGIQAPRPGGPGSNLGVAKIFLDVAE